ncbi:GNAT family N-acetyltransferase [Cytophagaceae bacterium YF14B1]|uniref:GNAT family N-acetyltransferase n=1 Tax=Xanthocytophaga flava TaxID=3048013 RepID=A0AAE3QYI9_9BACT|nr:GNAT family N-acetyltransferase [Xanthocytophaga flavus]MDJ1485109.1 GNAT family N-acetyltransferase [Xanthocytophaga flavus]
MSVTIRQATPADAAMLATLGKQTFESAFASQNTPENMEAYVSEAFTTEAFTEDIQDVNSLYYVAYINDSPVGYAKLRQNNNPEELTDPLPIELQRIYVDHNQIGTGVGKHLMEYCLKIASQQGFQTIWLGVWEHNTKAISFYQKWGFEVFGSHIFLLGDDPQTDLLMKRSL